MKILLFLLLTQGIFITKTYAEVSLAVTIDDLPRHGPLVKGETRVQVARRFVEAFRKAQLLEAYGFVNGKKLEGHPEELEVLKIWKAAGQPLGNHTYSHTNLAKSSAQEFIQDIERNEKILSPIENEKNFKWFRYPFLIEGDSFEKRNAIRSFLEKMDYRIAQVTIDFEDWAWNEPYVRCSEKKDQAAVSWLKKSYIEHALNRLDFSERAAKLLFGRAISHVLLLHIGTFDSIMFKDLIEQFRRQRVKFVSLKEAMADPIYNADPQQTMTYGETYLDQVILKRNLPYPIVPKLPLEELKKICL